MQGDGGAASPGMGAMPVSAMALQVMCLRRMDGRLRWSARPDMNMTGPRLAGR